MASLKTSFKVRKSSRRSSTHSCGKKSDDSHSKDATPHKDVVEATDVLAVKEPRSTRKSRSVVSVIRGVFQKCDGTVKSDSDSITTSDENIAKDCTPSSPTPPPLSAPVSLVGQSTRRRSGIPEEELTNNCKEFLSPNKRKSDEEDDSAQCSVSPVKLSRTPSNETSFTKPSPDSKQSPCKASNVPETPKSSQKEKHRRLSGASRATPRRLFSSPQKEGTYGGNSTPLRQELSDSFLTPENSPSKLNNSAHKSYARPYLSAKRCLHTAKPDRLIGRDAEVMELEDLVCDKLDSGESGSLYISGAPGTGKTAVVSYVVDKLKNQFGSLKAVFVNCMMLKDSNGVFSEIHQQLMGTPIKSKDALRVMEKLFTDCPSNILLVLDEIDQLDSKHQHILYSIFEWPALKGSKLILIGIANALDLTDRVLPRLQASRLCRPILMNFAPYTSVQITDILKQRLERDTTIEPNAINFCARKVAAVAGDVRKALDVCRRAVEMVESDVRNKQVLKPADCNSPRKSQGTPMKKVTLAHISKVMSHVYGSSVSAANNSENDVPLQQKLAVCTLLVLVKKGKFKEIQMGKLHDAYTKVCKRQQMIPVDQSEFHSILSLLDARGVVVLKKGKDTRSAKVSLKLDEQELEHTLKDKVLMATILTDGIPK